MEIVIPGTLCVAVSDASMVAEARRRVAVLSMETGFSETQAGRLAIVTTELATNLVKHADGGELYLVPTQTPAGPAIDLLAVDRGGGMSDVDACLRDGFSTAGSPGTGLGAISRLSSVFDMHTIVGAGSVVHVRIFGRGEPVAASLPRADVFGLCLAYPGLTTVGDAWIHRQRGAREVVLVVDGLGHGDPATQASQEALTAFARTADDASPAEILEELHLSLRSTRGAVAAVASIDFEREEMTYGGVGNIAAMIVCGSETKRLMSHNGTLGGNAPRLRQLPYPFVRGSLLVMSSDGLSTSVDVVRYPGLGARSAAVVAGTLMRDFRRERDDATVVAIREARSTP
ncbi:MAG TPA: SpoIIE family protein phosphatase [Candidatus Kapabacteria bacterium]|nr:SpoIIE family protein phosphatase [Candidatus Kapabacteria bacterium]